MAGSPHQWLEQEGTGTAESAPRASAAPALVLLKRQVDERWPTRSKLLDGIMRPMGLGSPSDHWVGNALDLNRAAGPYDELLLAHELVRQMRFAPVTGRLTYVIADGRIASGRHGWLWRPYSRSCPHRRHIHLSIKATHRHVVRPWALGRLPG